MDLEKLIDVANKVGTIGLLAVVVYGAYREWWVSGATFRRIMRERDFFRDELFNALGLVDRSSKVSEHVVETVRRSRAAQLEAQRDLRRRQDIEGTEDKLRP